MTTRANAAAAILVLFAGGCSAQQDAGMGAGAGGRAGLSPTPATPVPTPVADVAANRDAVADAYRRFWVVAYTLDSRPVTEWPTRLAAVATEPLLPKLLHALKAQHASGIREYGQVRPRPVTVAPVGRRGEPIPSMS